MRYARLLPVLLLVLGFTSPTYAAHITDKLVVGLYKAPKAEGTPSQLLTSGTPLDVLQRQDGFVEVRLNDDQTGWVEADYVTEEKPAKAMLLETQARLRQMGLELAKLREQSNGDGPADNVVTADNDAAQLQQALATSRERITTLEAALAERETAVDVQAQLDRLNAQVRSTLDQLAASQGLTLSAKIQPEEQHFLIRYQDWLIRALALVLGFVCGIAFIDYRFRRRHGGFRL